MANYAERCMDPIPTHSMIAAACGVNVSTVSRALNGNPAISEETRNRIREKAEAMGWRPNPLVSAYMGHLRSSRKIEYRANLAYVIPFPNARTIKEIPGYHEQHFYGCREHAVGLGYELEPIWFSEWGGNGAKLSRLLRSRGIPGVILHGISVTKEAYENFDWPSFAVASWGPASVCYNLHRAAANYFRAMQLALMRIRDYGYSKVALLLSSIQDHRSDHAYFASFLYAKAFERSGLRYEMLRLEHDTPYTPEKEMARRWLEKQKPDCVIAEQVIWELLNEMGWTIPDHVSYASIFWNPGWAHIGGVDQRVQAIGRNTVDLVVGQIVRNERGLPKNAKLLLNEGVWMDGPSCPDRRQPAKKPAAENVLTG